MHLRDGASLAAVVGYTAAQFGRAIVMPNLREPVITTEQALAYRQRILAALPEGSSFQPLMTLFLSPHTTAQEIERAKASGLVHGVKFYPANATTHSNAGVRDLLRMGPVLERMEQLGVPLLIHGESTRTDIDVFDREAVFIEDTLQPLLARFEGLKVVLEHVTTAGAVDFIQAQRTGVAATITPQHLLHNRNALFDGGIQPHLYCLPLLKLERDRLALVSAATGGCEKFFLGTDSAPHARHAKEAACGCAGIFTAHCAMELYAEVFDREDQLRRLEGFASVFGSRFYGLELNSAQLVLECERQEIPPSLPFGDEDLRPFRAGGSVAWTARQVAAQPSSFVR